tara:strand:+ start:746 stop:961 length:216 start_codon:yes stop_codon:yes gene_type:complete
MSVNESKEKKIVQETVPDFKINQKSSKIRLNVHTLNKRLNESRKADLVRNLRLILIPLSALAIIMLISFKF